jgi:predicted TPR repeat methyltransferase
MWPKFFIIIIIIFDSCQSSPADLDSFHDFAGSILGFSRPTPNIASIIYQDINRSVVRVLATNSKDETICEGTGFFIKPKIIITNLHVINGSSKIIIITSEGSNYPAENVLSKDISSDLACFSVNISLNNTKPIKINTTSPNVGDDILVIGYPEGPEGFALCMTQGSVSSVRTLNDYGEVIQIDAPISPGSSGSPLVNAKREAIGIITFNHIKGQNQNFAVSSKHILKLQNASSDGKPISGWNLTDYEELYAKGLDLYRKEKYNQSLYYFNESIEINPTFAEAWYGKGIALFEQGKYDEAIKAYNESIEINPTYAEAWYGKGVALSEQGKYDEAIKAYSESIEINPTFAEAWYGKYLALFEQGKYDEAIKAYNKSIEINPSALYHKVKAYNKSIEINLSALHNKVKAYNKSIKINPSAWYNKAKADMSLF